MNVIQISSHESASSSFSQIVMRPATEKMTIKRNMSKIRRRKIQTNSKDACRKGTSTSGLGGRDLTDTDCMSGNYDRTANDTSASSDRQTTSVHGWHARKKWQILHLGFQPKRSRNNFRHFQNTNFQRLTYGPKMLHWIGRNYEFMISQGGRHRFTTNRNGWFFENTLWCEKWMFSPYSPCAYW